MLPLIAIDGAPTRFGDVTSECVTDGVQHADSCAELRLLCVSVVLTPTSCQHFCIQCLDGEHSVVNVDSQRFHSA
eukprot:11020796-Alexandrium_andersonii.AAC.1